MKHWLYWIAGGITVVFAVFHAGNVLVIEDKLGKVHGGVEVGFDTFMLLAECDSLQAIVSGQADLKSTRNH
jgi:hypothetical protein